MARGFDAGIHSGEWLARDMIAVRISGETRMVIVAAPAHLAQRFGEAYVALARGRGCRMSSDLRKGGNRNILALPAADNRQGDALHVKSRTAAPRCRERSFPYPHR